MQTDTIALFEPEAGPQESALIQAVLDSGRWSDGPMLEAFEQAFAGWVGRAYAVGVASGTLGTWMALRAPGIGPGDEVVCAAHTWHQVAQAITLCGATPVFADIDYWSGCLSGDKAALLVIYCLADCWMSWNAAKRALAYGYTNVAWYPDGTDGWERAKLPTSEAQPEPRPEQ